jgi:uncharacterized membrane protein
LSNSTNRLSSVNLTSLLLHTFSNLILSISPILYNINGSYYNKVFVFSIFICSLVSSVLSSAFLKSKGGRTSLAIGGLHLVKLQKYLAVLYKLLVMSSKLSLHYFTAFSSPSFSFFSIFK